MSCEKDTEPTNFPPDVTTGRVENIYRKGATVWGTIHNPYGSIIESCGVEYSEDSLFRVSEKEVTTLSEQEMSVNITNLEPGKKYFCRFFAFSGYSYAYGETLKFQTQRNTPPVFGPTIVTNVGYSNFDVEAELLDDGGVDIIYAGFIWRRVTNETDTVSFENADRSIMKSVYQEKETIKDLYPGSLYVVRPYGIAGGVGYGECRYVRTEQTDETVLSSVTFTDTLGNTVGINASVLSEGTIAIEEYGFCYSTEQKVPTKDNLVINVQNVDNGKFSAVWENLKSEAKYYVRAYIRNANGEYVYGEVSEYVVPKHELLDVRTVEADSISTTGARIWGHVTANNVVVKERGFCWSETVAEPTLDKGQRIVVTTTDERFNASLETDPGITYYYRAYAINERDEVFYGEVSQFTSISISVPTVFANPATNVTETSATVSGGVTGSGEGTITRYGFCWSTTNAEPTTADSHQDMTGNAEAFSHTLDNLERGTTYYYRAYAENEKGIAYSEVRQFTTGITYAPTLSATTVTDITKTTATATATVEDNGGSEITERGFCISSETQSPTADNIKIVADGADGTFSVSVDALTEGTTYYIRAYAVNKNGIIYGPTTKFITVAIVLPTVFANPATNVTETSATVSGGVTNSGEGTITRYGFCWSKTNAEPTTADSHQDMTGSAEAFSHTLDYLERGTTYYYRAYAENEKGIAYSEVRQFTTQRIVNAPSVSDATISNIMQTSFTATATVTDDGRGTILEKGFCYMEGNGMPTTDNGKVLSTADGTTVTAIIDGLEAGKTYTVRAFVTNENGTAYSTPVVVTTKKSDPSIDDAVFPEKD